MRTLICLCVALAMVAMAAPASAGPLGLFRNYEVTQSACAACAPAACTPAACTPAVVAPPPKACAPATCAAAWDGQDGAVRHPVAGLVKGVLHKGKHLLARVVRRGC